MKLTLNHRVKYKKSWLVLGGIVLIALVVFLFFYIFFPPTVNVPRGADHPPVVTSGSPVPNSYDKVRLWFGPWKQLDPGNGVSTSLVMVMANGGLDKSSWAASPTKMWQSADPPQLGAITAGKTVAFQTNALATYVIGYNQPFILQQDPGHVYAFVRKGSGYKILSTTAEVLHGLGNNR